LVIEACINIGVPFFWQAPGSLLIEQSGVEEVVREVMGHGVELLGFEGFRLDPSMWPQLDRVLSVGTRAEVEGAFEQLRSWSPNTWIDITLSQPK
jgi:hypothetical protein